MKIIALISLTLLAFSGHAQVTTSNYTRYSYTLDSVQDVRLRIVANDVPTDGCNTYGLAGSLRRIENPGGGKDVDIDFLADFVVIQTQIFCSPKVTPGETDLYSDWTEIDDALILSVLVPSHMQVELQPLAASSQ